MSWRPDRIIRLQFESDPSVEQTVWDDLASQAPAGMVGTGLPASRRTLGRVESKFLNLRRRTKLGLEGKNIRPARGTVRLE